MTKTPPGEEMFKRNVQLRPLRVSPWRKLAGGIWRSAKDPSVYGTMDFPADGILRAIKDADARGEKLTPTVIVAKALANSIEKVPSVNAVRRFGRYYQRETIDIFLQVATDQQGEDLSGMLLKKANTQSLSEISQSIRAKAEKIRSKQEKEYSRGKDTMAMIPSILVRWVIDFLEILLYDFNLWSPLLGVPRDGFGSAMVTSVGMLGIERGYPPLVPYSRCPLLLAVGKIFKKPVVNEAGEIVVQEVLPLSATFDHRFLDGVGASHLLKELKAGLANPEQLS